MFKKASSRRNRKRHFKFVITS